MSSNGQKYKIKLVSGRILGPIDLDRVRLLISKNQITGSEIAREHPQGEWKDINQIPALADLLVARVHSQFGDSPSGESKEDEYRPILGTKATRPATTVVLPGATHVYTGKSLAPIPDLKTVSQMRPRGAPLESPEDKTVVAESQESKESQVDLESSRTEMVVKENFGKDPSAPEKAGENDGSGGMEQVLLEDESSRQELSASGQSWAIADDLGARRVSDQKTVVFQRSTHDPKLPGKKRLNFKEVIKIIVGALIVGSLGYDFLFTQSNQLPLVRIPPFRATLPNFTEGKPDSNKSMQIYNEGIKFYLEDTVLGYKLASQKFRSAAAYDIGNVKALALLASSYINLIDSSNKDENYFAVLSKIIDLSRAKAIDLPETVIADVEFYLIANRAEAAQNRIIEYAQSHPHLTLEMFYYLGLTYYNRGDPYTAVRYLNQLPDNKSFSAKVFYLKGLIAETLKDNDDAVLEYKKAIQFNPEHAKSHLKLANLISKNRTLKEAAPYIEFSVKHPELLAPKDLGLAYYLHCQLSELNQNWRQALVDIERAVKLDSDNHDYLLELYTLRAKEGGSVKVLQKEARMYYFLGEGEKLIQLGKYQDALVPLLQAREANDSSFLPLIKIGDMFTYLHDVENSKMNYKLAADRAPNNIQVWSKYIQALIQSYEWDEAAKAMARFRKLPVSQSSIDKAAADMYQKEGHFAQAQMFYRKAMARDSIDPDVYIAYAKSLMSTQDYKDAPFFFALALRFDPLNVDAVINTAKCIAATDSIDRAVSMLQDQLRQQVGARAEYLAAIAELEIQRGEWDEAQAYVHQAFEANPNYAYSWKLQAQIDMNLETQDRKALDKALAAYKSYSDRNPSDPSGYLERYKIFVKKTQFENAKGELDRIFQIYPKYPNLHYYEGALYSIEGNHKAAVEEFKQELSNNPNNLQARLAFGKELIQLGAPQDAIVQFTKARQLAPGSSEVMEEVGWAHYLIKDYSAAITLLNAALVHDRQNPNLYKRLGIVYRDMGDYPSACREFRKYLEMEPDAADQAEFSACR